MKPALIFFLTFLPILSYSQAVSDTLPEAEYYSITEAYLFKNDSVYTMQTHFVDEPSQVFIMKTGDSCIISIDHGDVSKVVFLGYATKIEDPGGFEFLEGDKLFYHWSYLVSGAKAVQEAIVVRQEKTEISEEQEYKFFIFHILFEDYQVMFYCDRTDHSI